MPFSLKYLPMEQYNTNINLLAALSYSFDSLDFFGDTSNPAKEMADQMFVPGIDLTKIQQRCKIA